MMKIAFVGQYYSEGMGYTENCLPRAFNELGHDCQVFCSTYNVYGHNEQYHDTYEEFLGKPQVKSGVYKCNGVIINRLEGLLTKSGWRLTGLYNALTEYNPDVIQVNAVISEDVKTAIKWAMKNNKVCFSECHVHRSVCPDIKPNNLANIYRYIKMKTNRSLNSRIINSVKLCFCISQDCTDVACNYFGLNRSRVYELGLGVDTSIMRPRNDNELLKLKTEIGIVSKYVFLYTGRLTKQKNPLLVAESIRYLRQQGNDVCGLFVGNGEQFQAIKSVTGCYCIPFVRHNELPSYYCLADIAVWPNQESMSMLDAMACGTPIIVSENMGCIDRIVDSKYQLFNNKSYKNLANVMLLLLNDKAVYDHIAKKSLSYVMQYSWLNVAKKRIECYNECL